MLAWALQLMAIAVQIFGIKRGFWPWQVLAMAAWSKGCASPPLPKPAQPPFEQPSGRQLLVPFWCLPTHSTHSCVLSLLLLVLQLTLRGRLCCDWGAACLSKCWLCPVCATQWGMSRMLGVNNLDDQLLTKPNW
eukprot:TRINITY_DN67368_c1_g2_i4.p1 TRINITY_DN67368_c1_g2~~TRINITY_DN67368_c1_g2_i4.p1  ORF type:complete len:134 (+),score=7.11 TRINITY_DN67368_c1_g2_i4:83-484(+)